MGTPDFAVASLKKLIESKNEISLVITQPDKPKGRGYILTPPPVKKFAIENNLEVFQPKTLKTDETLEKISNINPDVIVVVAYGKILPKNIIDMPKYGCINVHASLLPKYRGAAPIQWAIINGEKKTGVTTMYMDEGLDTGDMLLKEETEILSDETVEELHDKLSYMGANLLIKTLDALISKKIVPQKQQNDQFSYAPMINKNIALINWNKIANEIHNFIRGLKPWPAAYTYLNSKHFKIHKSHPVVFDGQFEPSEVISVNPLIVGCKNNTALELIEVQYEGKKRMNAKEFIKGHKIELKTKLGVK